MKTAVFGSYESPFSQPGVRKWTGRSHALTSVSAISNHDQPSRTFALPNPLSKHAARCPSRPIFSGYSPVCSRFIWTVSVFDRFSTEIRLDIIRRMPEIVHQACYCPNGVRARCLLWHLPQPDGNHTRAGRFPGSGEMRPLFTRSISNQ